MQKSILFAFVILTLSLASAEYIEKNFYKSPVSIVNETSLQLYGLSLEDHDSANISLSSNMYIPPYLRTPFWAVWSRKFDANTFETISTTNQTYLGSASALFSAGYAIDLDQRFDQVLVNQFNFDQNVSLPSISLNASIPAYYSPKTLRGMVYITGQTADSIKIVTFKAGETSVRHNISIPVPKMSFTAPQIVTGGVLSANQVLMTVQNNDYNDVTYLEILVDIEKESYNLSQVSNFNRSLGCSPYVTNKFYGSFCSGMGPGVMNYYVTRNNSGKFELLLTLGDNEKMAGQFTSGDYLVTIVQKMGKDLKPNVMSYEFWNLETMSSVKGRTDFIIGDKYKLTRSFYQSQSGDLYVLLYNQWPATVEEVRLGVLLSHNASDVKVSFGEDELIQNFLA